MHIIVVGSGIAGLIAALELAGTHQVTLVTKSSLHEANTRYAQGGIAAVMHPDDNVEEHIEDTLRAGAGLCRPEAVRILCTEGPDRIRDLIRLGVAFDQHNGALAQGREAAHSRARVLHAGGDATGLAIETALVTAVQQSPHIRVLEHTFAADLQLSISTDKVATPTAIVPQTVISTEADLDQRSGETQSFKRDGGAEPVSTPPFSRHPVISTEAKRSGETQSFKRDGGAEPVSTPPFSRHPVISTEAKRSGETRSFDRDGEAEPASTPPFSHYPVISTEADLDQRSGETHSFKRDGGAEPVSTPSISHHPVISTEADLDQRGGETPSFKRDGEAEPVSSNSEPAPKVTGLHILHPDLTPELLPADAVILAAGGAGHLYPYTTNPAVATGDGIALALRAGAELADLEFYQFHPTALSAEGGFLISEAVRGDGAVLRNQAGERFMQAVHPDAELAPRDVVARGIAAEMARQDNQPVLLDATHLGADFLRTRFPTIDAACRRAGLDWATQPIPVAPAAHYWMGGIATDSWGRTSVPGLFAVGEVACTGVHGANRLASNSLLESIVFAHRAARLLRETNTPHPVTAPENPRETANSTKAPLKTVISTEAPLQSVISTEAPLQSVISTEADLEQRSGETRSPQRDGEAEPVSRQTLQHLMWQAAGITRNGPDLQSAQTQLRHWLATSTPPKTIHDRETGNLLQLGEALVTAALAREESRGAHYRSDFPAPRDSERHHITVSEPVEVSC